MLKPFLIFPLLLTSLSLQAQEYTKYLFAYFPSNSDENIYFALSDKDDPYNFQPINQGRRVVSADSVSVMNGLRDPHLMRGEDGWFYMVATDMRCSLGWSSNRGLVLMRSKDLVSWSHHTVHFPDKYAGSSLARVTRVWAPETIWDPVAKRYMVYFSLLTDDGSIPYDRVYYCYVNADFSDLDGEPAYLFDRGKSTIDMDIVYSETDGRYHAIYKNEGDGGICMVTAASLTPAEGEAPGSQWSAPSAAVQQTNVAVEGGGLYKLIDSDQWVLMYDCYGSGYYQFCTSTDLEHFSLVHQTATSGAFTPRHGSVIPITEAEYETLTRYWQQKADETVCAEHRRQLSDLVRHASAMHVDTKQAEKLTADLSASPADLLLARHTLLEEMEQKTLSDYTSSPLLQADNWTAQNNLTQRSGQHWKGSDSANRYYEQRNGWGSSAWNMYMTQDIVLPEGDYVLRAACRSASADVSALLKVNDRTALFPADGDSGRGIDCTGKTSWADGREYTNQGAGRGWEWRYIPFHSDGTLPTTLGAEASVSGSQHQWMSVADFELYRYVGANAIHAAGSGDGTACYATISEPGVLTLHGTLSKSVVVYNEAGVEVFATTGTADTCSIPLAPGVYLVKVGDHTLKVAL